VSNEVNFAATPGIWLQSVVSRMSHAGTTFDVNLPLFGIGIECRTSGSGGNYTMVFTFANPVASVDSATVTSGTGSVSTAFVQGGAYVVNLTGVANAQRLGLTLTNVQDSAGNSVASVSPTIGVLIGDVNASGRVDAADVSSVRQQTLQPVTASNFRNDINASGRIDAADVSIARQQTLTSLP
jgi:hypothetical protein